jgi:hypothetical protein
MSSLSMSWTFGYGQSCRGGNKKGVSWVDIERALLEVGKHSGTVTIDVVDGPVIGPQSLQVQKEGEVSILSLGEYDGEDYNVRSFTNDATEKQQIEILGNLWDARMICSEFDLVIKIFKEFFETGNVSRKLLS